MGAEVGLIVGDLVGLTEGAWEGYGVVGANVEYHLWRYR